MFGKMESMKCMNEGCGKTMTMGWKKGWELKSGASAVLCVPCGTAYEDSKYCSSFHQEESGWRECKFCNAPIHCGCIASQNLHINLDFGGVGCNRCVNATELRLATAIPKTSIGNPSTLQPSILSRPASSNGRIIINHSLDSVTRESSASTPNKPPTHNNRTVNAAVHLTDQTAVGAEANHLQKPRIKPENMPKITEQELVQLSKALNSTIVPLFEKQLSATDASQVGRFCVPKACAKAFFPALGDDESVDLCMKDIDGTDWNFRYRNSLRDQYRGPTYYLDIKSCLPFLRLRPRDIVTFCKMEPSQQLVISYCRSTDTDDFPVNQNNHQDPSGQPSSSSRAYIGLPSDGSDHISEEDEGPANKRARRSRESMGSTISWIEGQELLCPPTNCNYTVVMVHGYELQEYDDPPVIGAEQSRVDSGTEPTPAATSSHREHRSRRRKLHVPRRSECGLIQLGESSRSAKLAVGPSSSNRRNFDLNLNPDIQNEDGLEFSKDEGTIDPREQE